MRLLFGQKFTVRQLDLPKGDLTVNSCFKTNFVPTFCWRDHYHAFIVSSAALCLEEYGVIPGKEIKPFFVF